MVKNGIQQLRLQIVILDLEVIILCFNGRNLRNGSRVLDEFKGDRLLEGSTAFLQFHALARFSERQQVGCRLRFLLLFLRLDRLKFQGVSRTFKLDFLLWHLQVCLRQLL